MSPSPRRSLLAILVILASLPAQAHGQQPASEAKPNAVVSAQIDTTICTNTVKAGDRVLGTVHDSADVPKPLRGGRLYLTVVEANGSTNVNIPLKLVVRADSITSNERVYILDSTVTKADLQRVRVLADSTGAQKGAKQQGAVTGTVVGAIAGALIGGNATSAIKGANAASKTNSKNAVIGAAALAATAHYEGCVRGGTTLKIELWKLSVR